MEVWKDIRGYEGFYQVSNYGRIKSVGIYKHIHGKNVYVVCDRIMTPTDNGYGYLIVALKKLGKRKNYYIHRLVAEYFVENPFSKRCVNHIDYNKKNNMAINLEWVTQKENVMHSSDRMKHPKKVYKKSNTGEKYITKKGERYRVAIRQHNVDRSFSTLEEAVEFKKGVLYEIGIAI